MQTIASMAIRHMLLLRSSLGERVHVRVDTCQAHLKISAKLIPDAIPTTPNVMALARTSHDLAYITPAALLPAACCLLPLVFRWLLAPTLLPSLA